MREIKFKAKDENGFWTYGDLIHTKHFTYILDTFFIPAKSLPAENFIEVIPETVCRYVTDFEDCEGRDCYEGDICTTVIIGVVKEGFITYCDRNLQWVLSVDGDNYPLNEIGVYNTRNNIHD